MFARFFSRRQGPRDSRSGSVDEKARLTLGTADREAASQSHSQGHHRRERASRWWKVGCFFLLITTVVQIPFNAAWKKTPSSFATGFDTDFPGTGSAVRLIQRRFGYPIRSTNDDGRLVPGEDDGMRFVGPPTFEMDEAWDILTSPRYFELDDEEVNWLNKDMELPELYSFPRYENITRKGARYGGVDMMHSLHCLNALRKKIDGEYYKMNMNMPEEFMRMHIDHCINQLRETVMCHADLTPVTLKPVTWHHKLSTGEMGETFILLAETERKHTCRDPDLIRRWVDEKTSDRGYAY